MAKQTRQDAASANWSTLREFIEHIYLHASATVLTTAPTPVGHAWRRPSDHQ
jgi:hypothetical protein